MTLIVGAIAVLLVGLYTYYNITLPPLEEPTDKKPAVATTMFPLYDITRQITGDAVAVELLLPPGASPHTFEPAPSTFVQLQKVDAIYAFGYGSDDWVTDLLMGSSLEVVTVDTGVALHSVEEEHEDEKLEAGSLELEHEEDGHEHGDVDPHYWLSIPNAKTIAANVAADLNARYPEQAAVFAQNLSTYLEQLDQADQEIRDLLAGVSNRQIVTMHSAWYYFAEEYGLEIAATFEPTPGREPTPQYLAALSRAVSESGVRTIYSEPQLATDALEPFIADHGISIAVLDPLGGLQTRDNYISTMLFNAQVIAKNQ